MKRSKGQDQGRPTQFKTRKKQTTVRIPEDVLLWLLDKYDGILQRAIDAILIIPTLREMGEPEIFTKHKISEEDDDDAS